MKILGEFFQEDNGGWSMARLIVFMMCCLHFFQGIWQIIHTGNMSASWQDVAAVLGPFYIKTYQKRFEEKPPPGNSQDTPLNPPVNGGK